MSGIGGVACIGGIDGDCVVAAGGLSHCRFWEIVEVRGEGDGGEACACGGGEYIGFGGGTWVDGAEACDGVSGVCVRPGLCECEASVADGVGACSAGGPGVESGQGEVGGAVVIVFGARGLAGGGSYASYGDAERCEQEQGQDAIEEGGAGVAGEGWGMKRPYMSHPTGFHDGHQLK